MHAALDVNIPSCASAIVTTKEVVEPISALRTLGTSAYTVGPGCDFALPFAQSAMTAGSAGTGRHRSLSSRPTMRGRLFRAFRSGLGPTKQVPFEMQVLRALMTVSPPVWSSRCGQAVSLIAFDAYCVPC